MGATGWSYFTPYRQDVNQALQELKDEVFRKGKYEKPFEFDSAEFERQRAFLTSIYLELPEALREQTMQFLDFASAAAKRRRKPRRTPKTIRQLLKACGTEGTHSILDIVCTSSVPVFGAVVPLSDRQLMDIFGTEQPTHEMVAKWSTRIDPLDAEPLYERWGGIYVIVFKGDKPDEIYFEGCSGD
jgi:hypothetical protein